MAYCCASVDGFQLFLCLFSGFSLCFGVLICCFFAEVETHSLVVTVCAAPPTRPAPLMVETPSWSSNGTSFANFARGSGVLSPSLAVHSPKALQPEPPLTSMAGGHSPTSPVQRQLDEKGGGFVTIVKNPRPNFGAPSSGGHAAGEAKSHGLNAWQTEDTIRSPIEPPFSLGRGDSVPDVRGVCPPCLLSPFLCGVTPPRLDVFLPRHFVFGLLRVCNSKSTDKRFPLFALAGFVWQESLPSLGSHP